MFVAGLLVVAMTAASGASTKSGATRQPVVAPITGFGGYLLNVKVSRISAQWVVPKIAATSPPGIAATWVGAQNIEDSDFIQLGILEIANGGGDASYEAFWSDTEKQFAPQSLERLSAGDKISVSMARDAKGWLLNFDDRRNASSVTKQINYDAAGRFTQGDWLQEDPSPSRLASKDVTYPDLADVTFQKMMVNGHRPKLVQADGVTLSATGGALEVPTPVKDDAFTFVRPKGAADQYLIDAAVIDAATAKLNVQVAQWSTASTTTKTRDVKAIESVFTFEAGQFRSQTWPGAAQSGVHDLIQFIVLDISNFKGWSAAGFKLSGPAFEKLQNTVQEESGAVDKLRASLGLPPP